MERLSFHRLNGSSLYLPDSQDRFGLLLDTPGPDSVHLSQVWGTCVLVIWHPDINTSVFFPRLPGELSDLEPDRGRIAFFSPGQDADFRRQATFQTGADGSTLSQSVAVHLDGESYSVRTWSGSKIQVNDDKVSVEAPQGRAHGWTFVREGGGTVELAIDGPLTLPLTGPAPGTFTFELSVDDPGLDDLGVHLRFSKAGPWRRRSGGRFSSTVRGHRFPIFRADTDSIRFDARFDPLSPLDPERTRLGFPTDRALGSEFETVSGHGLTLKPLDGAALLLDHGVERISQNLSVLSGLTYLTPNGSFEMGLEPHGAADNDSGSAARSGEPRDEQLVTGISTSEFVPFRVGDLLTFHAKQPATDPRGLTPPGAASRQSARTTLELHDLTTIEDRA